MATPESGAAIEAIIPAFQAKNPNITVDYKQTNFDDYNKSINLELDSDRAPDVVLLNSVGTTVKNKLVRDLDPYVAAYGWDKVFPSTQLNQWRVAEDGTTLGSGSLVAVPAGFSIVGLYYNKDLAQKIGMTTPPTDLASMESAMAKAKAAGVLPVQLGNAEGHASFIVQLIGQAVDGAEPYADWVFGTKGATFDTPGNQQGMDALKKWQDAGYFPSGANGTDLQGAVDKFTKGEGLFFVDGNWDAKKIGDAMGDSVGFVPFPGPAVTAIGTSAAYGISSRSENPDAAGVFLDFLRGPEGAKAQFEQGFLPADTAAIGDGTTGVRADILSAWTKVNDANGLVGFNNNSTATMNDTLKAATQTVLGGKATPKDAIAEIQADWSGVHGG